MTLLRGILSFFDLVMSSWFILSKKSLNYECLENRIVNSATLQQCAIWCHFREPSVDDQRAESKADANVSFLSIWSHLNRVRYKEEWYNRSPCTVPHLEVQFISVWSQTAKGVAWLLIALLAGQSTLKLYYKMQIDREWVTLAVWF